MIYYRLPGDSPVIKTLNQAAKSLIYEKANVDVQVAEYGYISFATARSAAATIDPSNRTITVELPTPTVRTYIYSVGKASTSDPIPRISRWHGRADAGRCRSDLG